MAARDETTTGQQDNAATSSAAIPAAPSNASTSADGSGGESSQPSNQSALSGKAQSPPSAESAKGDEGSQDTNQQRTSRRRRMPFARVNRGAAGLNFLGMDNGKDEEKAASAKSADAPQTSSQEEDGTSEPKLPSFKGDLPWSQRGWVYELRPFRGMYYDIRRRAPYYLSDWTETFKPRNWWTTAQAVVRIYFINLMPAIAYVLDMYHRTNGAYGVNEVILASALAAIVFPVFSVQPLTFVGVTGLINLVNYTQYDIVVGYYGLGQMDYLRVQAWSLIWAAGFHFIAAIFNLCDFTRFITDMTSTTFGFYVGIVYIQKGIELLILEYEPLPLDNATGWLSVTTAMLFVVSVYLVSAIGRTSYLPYRVRSFVATFAFTAGCIFWTGFSHFPKNSLERVPIEQLPITRSFFPTMDRSWFIDFWNIEAKWAFVGAPLGFLITILFWFDHNVSSIMAQARQFPVKRPAGFHWDFFLLGITTLVAGFLGLPAPNGLVPQCPWHTEALSVFKQTKIKDDQDESDKAFSNNGYAGNVRKQPAVPKREHIINTRVVEQRGSHLLIGALTLATMSRPFLVALGTMPRAVFAGIFLLVGWGSIEGNIITSRTLAVFRDRALAPADDPLNQVRRSKIALFAGIQWFFFAITFAISQTIAGIGFPVLITLLIPFRYYVVPKWFSPLELRILDAPTADADVVLASVGHESERCTGQGVRLAADTKIAGSEYHDDENNEDEDDNFGADSAQPGHSAAKTNDIRPYSLDDEDEVEQTICKPQAQQRHKTTSRSSNHSSVPAVQPSPFTTSFNMREEGISYLEEPAFEFSKRHKKGFFRRLIGISGPRPSREGQSAPSTASREGQSAPSSASPGGDNASNTPAMPANTSQQSSKQPGKSSEESPAAIVSGHPASRDVPGREELERKAQEAKTEITLSGLPSSREKTGSAVGSSKSSSSSSASERQFDEAPASPLEESKPAATADGAEDKAASQKGDETDKPRESDAKKTNEADKPEDSDAKNVAAPAALMAAAGAGGAVAAQKSKDNTDKSDPTVRAEEFSTPAAKGKERQMDDEQATDNATVDKGNRREEPAAEPTILAAAPKSDSRSESSRQPTDAAAPGSREAQSQAGPAEGTTPSLSQKEDSEKDDGAGVAAPAAVLAAGGAGAAAVAAHHHNKPSPEEEEKRPEQLDNKANGTESAKTPGDAAPAAAVAQEDSKSTPASDVESRPGQPRSAGNPVPAVIPASTDSGRPSTSTSGAPPSSATPFARTGSTRSAAEWSAMTGTGRDPSVSSAAAPSSDRRTTETAAAAVGVASIGGATALARRDGREQPDEVDRHEAARLAAAETLRKAEESERRIDEDKKNKRLSAVRAKEEKAIQKKKIADAKKTLKEEERKKKAAEKDRAIALKERAAAEKYQSRKEQEANRRSKMIAAEQKQQADTEMRVARAQAVREEEELQQQKRKEEAEARKIRRAEEEAEVKRRKIEEKEIAERKARVVAAAEAEAAQLKHRDEQEAVMRRAEHDRLMNERKLKDEQDAAERKQKAETDANAAAAAILANAKKDTEDRRKKLEEESAARQKQDDEDSAKRKHEAEAAAVAAAAAITAAAEKEAADYRRKAEEEAEEHKRKLESEAAEKNRQEEEALAERQKKIDAELNDRKKAVEDEAAERKRKDEEAAAKREAEATAAVSALTTAAINKREQEDKEHEAKLSEASKTREAEERAAAAARAQLDEREKEAEERKKEAEEARAALEKQRKETADAHAQLLKDQEAAANARAEAEKLLADARAQIEEENRKNDKEREYAATAAFAARNQQREDEEAAKTARETRDREEKETAELHSRLESERKAMEDAHAQLEKEKEAVYQAQIQAEKALKTAEDAQAKLKEAEQAASDAQKKRQDDETKAEDAVRRRHEAEAAAAAAAAATTAALAQGEKAKKDRDETQKAIEDARLKGKLASDKQAQQELEEKRQHDRDVKAREAAELKARKAAEKEQAKRDAEEKARHDKEVKAHRKAEEKAKKEAEKAEKEAQKKARKEMTEAKERVAKAEKEAEAAIAAAQQRQKEAEEKAAREAREARETKAADAAQTSAASVPPTKKGESTPRASVASRKTEERDPELAGLAAAAAATVGHEVGKEKPKDEEAAPEPVSEEAEAARPIQNGKRASVDVSRPTRRPSDHQNNSGGSGFLKRMLTLGPRSSSRDVKSKPSPSDKTSTKTADPADRPRSLQGGDALKMSISSPITREPPSTSVSPTSPVDTSAPQLPAVKTGGGRLHTPGLAGAAEGSESESTPKSSKSSAKASIEGKSRPPVPETSVSDSGSGPATATAATTSAPRSASPAPKKSKSRKSMDTAHQPTDASPSAQDASSTAPTTSAKGTASNKPSRLTGAFHTSLTGTPTATSYKASHPTTGTTGKDKSVVGPAGSRFKEESTEQTREIEEDGKKFIEHVNPRFAKQAAPSKISAVQWRKL